jgi:uncharacterized protein YbjT (DUF2867 family)
MRILVTGGGGFLGQALCRGLVARGHGVVSFNRGRYRALDALGVHQRQGDLADRDAVLAAARDCEAIFHNAAKAGAWGSYDSYHRANVVGTGHVIAACRAHGIRQLVYTSSPSVTHRATHPVAGGTADTVPYGEHLKAPYAATKAIAERAVLAANDASLATIALRPRLIWGPGDQQLLPRLAERARRTPAPGRRWRQPDRHDLHRQRGAGALRRVRPARARSGLRRARVLHQQWRTARRARHRQRAAAGRRCATSDEDVAVSPGVCGGGGVRSGVDAVAAARRATVDALPGRAAGDDALVRHAPGDARLRLCAARVDRRRLTAVGRVIARRCGVMAWRAGPLAAPARMPR